MHRRVKNNLENKFTNMVESYQTKPKIEERDIILEIVKEVSKKFLVEFKSGSHKKIVHHGNWSEEITEPDSRKEAIQGVELLTSLLRPHFNDKKCEELKMKEKYDTLIEARKELVEQHTEDLKTKDDAEDVFISDKLMLLRDWFGELIMLLHAIKYLTKKRAA